MRQEKEKRMPVFLLIILCLTFSGNGYAQDSDNAGKGTESNDMDSGADMTVDAAINDGLDSKSFHDKFYENNYFASWDLEQRYISERK